MLGGGVSAWRRSAGKAGAGARWPIRDGRRSVPRSAPHSSTWPSVKPSRDQQVDVGRDRAVLLDDALGQPVGRARAFIEIASRPARSSAGRIARPAGIARAPCRSGARPRTTRLPPGDSARWTSASSRVEVLDVVQRQRAVGELEDPPAVRAAPCRPARRLIAGSVRVGARPRQHLFRDIDAERPAPRPARAPSGRTSRSRSRDRARCGRADPAASRATPAIPARRPALRPSAAAGCSRRRIRRCRRCSGSSPHVNSPAAGLVPAIRRLTRNGLRRRRGGRPAQGRAPGLILVRLDSLLQPIGFSQLTIHGVPNWSVSMPKRTAQKVSAMGIVTVPFSASAWKTRSASAAVSTPSASVVPLLSS